MSVVAIETQLTTDLGINSVITERRDVITCLVEVLSADIDLATEKDIETEL